MALSPQVPGYNLQRRLGAGGMGVVYLATRDDTDYRYAIKMLVGGRDAPIEDLARFRVEAEAYACLNHPYIIKIRDVGVVSGCPFLAMDYAEHGSLTDLLAEHPAPGMDWCVRVIQSVAEALIHAHGRRILHRDLKPANILIAADGSPRLSDFGLVKFSAPVSAVSASCCTFSVAELDQHLLQMTEENRRLLPVQHAADVAHVIDSLTEQCAARSGISTQTFDHEAIRSFVSRSADTRKFSGELSPLLDDLTRPDAVVGTPRFMSPEQAQGRIEDIGAHTDVYGLGATLYYLVCRQFPISGRNTLEIIQNVSKVEPIAPSALNAAVPEDLSLVIMKALSKDFGRRYPDMEAFADDLGRVSGGRAPLARLSRLHVKK